MNGVSRREMTRAEKLAETMGMIVTLAMFSAGVIGLLFAIANSAEAQSIYPVGTAQEGEAYPTGENVTPTNTQGGCYRFDTYHGKCQVDEVKVPADEVFHPNGQSYREHWFEAGRQLCKYQLAEAEYAYNYYVTNHGEEHGATQLFKYRLEIQRGICSQFEVE
jgi:hypothetical protein